MDVGETFVMLLHPMTGKKDSLETIIKEGRLKITLPAFYEDLAIHILLK